MNKQFTGSSRTEGFHSVRGAVNLCTRFLTSESIDIGRKSRRIKQQFAASIIRTNETIRYSSQLDNIIVERIFTEGLSERIIKQSCSCRANSDQCFFTCLQWMNSAEAIFGGNSDCSTTCEIDESIFYAEQECLTIESYFINRSFTWEELRFTERESSLNATITQGDNRNSSILADDTIGTNKGEIFDDARGCKGALVQTIKTRFFRSCQRYCESSWERSNARAPYDTDFFGRFTTRDNSNFTLRCLNSRACNLENICSWRNISKPTNISTNPIFLSADSSIEACVYEREIRISIE